MHFVAAAQEHVTLFFDIGRLEPDFKRDTKELALGTELDGKEGGVVREDVGDVILGRTANPMRHGAGNIVSE